MPPTVSVVTWSKASLVKSWRTQTRLPSVIVPDCSWTCVAADGVTTPDDAYRAGPSRIDGIRVTFVCAPQRSSARQVERVRLGIRSARVNTTLTGAGPSR
jgi:hypothetical protein